MIRKSLFKNNKNIEIHTVNGLLTEFAKKCEADCIIRGLRAVSDFEYEFQMTGMNYQLNPKIETIFLMSADNNSFISSNLVKEVHKLGGDVSKFVSENTIKILNYNHIIPNYKIQSLTLNCTNQYSCQYMELDNLNISNIDLYLLLYILYLLHL